MTEAIPRRSKRTPDDGAQARSGTGVGGAARVATAASSAKDTFATGLSDGRFWAQPAYFMLILAGLGLNMFSGNWSYMRIPLPLDRMLILGGLVLAFMDPNTRYRERLQWRPLHSMMVAFSLWAVYSAMTAGTLSTVNGFYALLDRIIVPFALFSLGAVIFDDRHRRALLLKMLTLIGIYLGITAFFEMVGPSSLVFPRYIMNPDLGILFGRARGPFITAEADGMVMAMSMFAAGVLYARTSSKFWRRVAPISIAVSAMGAVLTMTRSIWLGMVLAVLASMYLVPQIRKPLFKAGVAGGALLAFVLLAIAPAREAFLDRLTTERSVNDRQNTNAAAVRILEEHPLTGIGWHRFVDIGAGWVRQADTYPITAVDIEVHNVLLSRAAELGVPAALLWVAIVAIGPAFALAYRQKGDMQSFKILAVAAFIIWLVPTFSSPNPYPMPNFLMWLLTGIAAHRYLLSEPMRT